MIATSGEISTTTLGGSQPEPPRPSGRYLLALSVGALGVVFGDIGTSPLYALRECFAGHRLPVTPTNVLGILSLVFWSLILVISVKYLAIVLKADSRGEGGILVLTSLISPPADRRAGARAPLLVLGLFGACLLYGDSVITPAITVLSAVEGIEIATPALRPYVVPASVVILVGLFLIQKRGTGKVGAIFGPVMLVWFGVLAVSGATWIVREPKVLFAVDPVHAVRFFREDGFRGFLLLGSVVLAVTGGEALYADMGHFGARPIRVTWFTVVLPALLLNYFGQGALLLANPAAADNPLFKMVPPWALSPLVVLATFASVIASQAVISGAFSLTRQAIQLGFLPRMRIEHTSAREIGQIYLPGVNWLLLAACVWLVLEFGSSSRLAAAYGLAVTSTMAVTTLLLVVHARDAWHVRPWLAYTAAAFFLVIDFSFLGANLVKVAHGGWFPLAVAGGVYLLMATWKKGRALLATSLAEGALPVELFLASVAKSAPIRVKGSAIYLSKTGVGVPAALLHNLKHNKVLHERVVFLTVVTDEVPLVRPRDRAASERLGNGCWRVTLRYGFMQDVDVPRALRKVKLAGTGFEEMDTTYFLTRETLIASDRPGMANWRDRLFALMTRTHGQADAYFGIPPGRVVELGLQIEI